LSRLVEPPVGLGAANALCYAEGIESSVGQIEIATCAAHALVLDGSLDGSAAVVDGDGLSAEWVAVALLAHEVVCERDNVVNGAVVGDAACAEAGFIEGDVAVAWGALSALAGWRSTTGSRGWGWGWSSRGGWSWRRCVVYDLRG